MTASQPVLTRAHLQRVVDEFMTFDEFVFDTETKGTWRLDPRRNEVFWLGLAGPGGRVEVIPFGHPHGEQTGIGREPRADKNGKIRQFKVPTFGPAPVQLSPEEVFSALKPLFFSDARKIGHTVKFDLESCAKYWGELPPPPFGDTEILLHVLNENHHGKTGLGALTEKLFGKHYDKSIGAAVETYAFSTAAKYLHYDVFYTWLSWQTMQPDIDAEGLRGVVTLDEDMLNVLMHMEHVGTPFDVPRAEAFDRELDRELAVVKRQLYEISGREWNLNSNPQKQQIFFGPKSAGGQGLKPKKFTKGGAPSCDGDALEEYVGNPLVDAYIRYGDLDKASGTYVKSYLGTAERKSRDKNKNQAPAVADDGRVHPNFRLARTVTGRLSCVSGSTVLTTSRGAFRMDEYVPQPGDLVPTHRGRWCPVIRKLYKGLDEMFRVCLANGDVLDCTAEHRLLTPRGWEYVGGLRTGDEVLSYERFPDLPSRPHTGRESGVCVLGRGQTHLSAVSYTIRNESCDGAAGACHGAGTTALSSREGIAILTVEGGQQEPYVGQEWFAAPQPHRGRGRRSRPLAAEGERQVCAGAPIGDGRSAGVGRVARVGGGTSHRRGQDEQRAGQPRTGDSGWARLATSRQKITTIIPLGRMGVWDIEVEGDHSYLAQGFFHHNCSEPNLQNIPRPDTDLGKRLRSLFIAPPGHKLIVADFSQIEYVVLAHYSNDPVLLKFFAEERDFHKAVASMILKLPEDQITKPQRTMCKNVNFAAIYGAQDEKVAAMSGTTVKDAARFRAEHRNMLPKVYEFTDNVVRTCRARRPVPYVHTILGRRRRLPQICWSADGPRKAAERQAINSVIQGTASDINKIAAVRVLEMCRSGWHPLLTVHDEFVVSVPNGEVDEAIPVIREAMIGDGVQELLRAKLGVDIQAVERWSDAKE